MYPWLIDGFVFFSRSLKRLTLYVHTYVAWYLLCVTKDSEKKSLFLQEYCTQCSYSEINF